MPSRLTPLILAAALGAACGTKPPAPGPLGPETCNNKTDDNGDGKIDCLDPKCFQDAACRGMGERCDNDVDDNGDSLIDCADPLCAGQACGFDCTCIGGVKVMGSSGGGAGGGGGTTGGGSGGGATGGGSGGGTTGGGSGGGATGGGAAGGGTATVETNCADNLDNDGDNATDCDDSDCVGITCGMGCVCALNRKTEVNCSDGTDNDGDQSTDCADSDCVGVGTENCTDGVDNNCNRAIDCGDPGCTGAACTGLQDGKPCLADAQCAGNKCFTEAATGAPNGACGNAAACTPGTTTGCNGGFCAGNSRCYAACTGQGLTGTGACRAGFICYDPDSTASNNNNYCLPGCSSDTECSGGGTGYGCNPWSKRCQNTNQNLPKYGATCTTDSQCESGYCFTGPDFPLGYCVGVCRGNAPNCASGGFCMFNASYGDNLGICYQACSTYNTPPDPECGNPLMSCFKTSSTSTNRVCSCLSTGSSCIDSYDCCSGSCTGFFSTTCN